MSCSNPFRITAFLLATLCATSTYAQGPYGSRQFYQPQQIDRYIGEQTPDIWDESQPIERFLTAVAQRSWLSVEYLHWHLDGPTSGSMGAPITDIADPSVPFQAFDVLNGGANTGLAIVPNSNSLEMDDTSGVRGTLGVALNGGALEVSFFGTQQTDSELQLNNLQAGRVAGAEAIGTMIRPNVVTPLLTSGTATTSTAMNSFVYDDSFQAFLDGQLWGAEFLLLQDLYLPQENFNWQWLGGFRYVSYDEQFQQTGSFTNGGGLVPSRVTQIGADTINNVYGPEVGGRASIRTKYVTLSATPRIALALNDHTSTVTTGSLITGVEPTVRIIEESIDFSPIVEINLQMQIHLTSHFSIFGGYDFFYILQASRPNSNIVYDSTPAGGSFTPNIRQQVDLENFMARGLNLGGILTY